MLCLLQPTDPLWLRPAFVTSGSSPEWNSTFVGRTYNALRPSTSSTSGETDYRSARVGSGNRGPRRARALPPKAGRQRERLKPYSLHRAHLRRWLDEPGNEETIVIGDLTLDLQTRVVSRWGEPLRLTRTEFEILRYLAINTGKILTHSMILQYVWGAEHREDVATLRVHVAHLRQKIEEDPENPRLILTEIGVGYRFASS
jgi:DNA-binding winged helix-turn-helix (wHTH) protein